MYYENTFFITGGDERGIFCSWLFESENGHGSKIALFSEHFLSRQEQGRKYQTLDVSRDWTMQLTPVTNAKVFTGFEPCLKGFHCKYFDRS